MPLRLRGRLDRAAFDAAVADVLARHESLRTLFPDLDGAPCQQVIAAEDAGNVLEFVRVDARTLERELHARALHVFDLAAELPLRISVLSASEDEHVLLVVLHHIAGDGSSLAPLARDLGRAYAARLRGQTPEWAPLPVQYPDYTLWQQRLLGSEADADSLIAQQFDYWREQLAGLPERIELPTDRPRPAIASLRGRQCKLQIDASLHARLLSLAHQHEASLFMVLQAGLSALLHRLGAGEDIAVGSAIAGRNDQALDELVGFFVNTLVLRTDLSGRPDFATLLGRVRATALAAYTHQDAPFERLVELLNPVRSTAHHALFQVGLVLQNIEQAVLELPGLEVSDHPADFRTAKFDLFFSLNERHHADGAPAGMAGTLEYASDLFDESSVLGLWQRLLRLLDAACADPARRIADIDLLDADERAGLRQRASDGVAAGRGQHRRTVRTPGRARSRRAGAAVPRPALELRRTRPPRQPRRPRADRAGHRRRGPRRHRPAAFAGHGRRRARRAQGRRGLSAAGPGLSAGAIGLHARRRPAGAVDQPARDRSAPARARRRAVAARRRADRAGAGRASRGRAARTHRLAAAGRVRHLHLRLHRPAQGRGGEPRRRAEPVGRADRRVRGRTRRARAAVRLAELRRRVLGTVHGAAVGRRAGDGRRRTGAPGRGADRADARARRHPRDPAAGGAAGAGTRCRAAVARPDRRRRSLRAAAGGGLVARPPHDQRLRPDRNHGVRDHERAAGRRGRCADRRADPRRACTCSTPACSRCPPAWPASCTWPAPGWRAAISAAPR
ncbi:hypothetical protein FE772_18070 [Lysobacter enzymogenes]|nr:hypothetical protein FE772_18070 [Lysobacter enzymogenes]